MRRFQILPTETRSFDLFDQHANTLLDAALALLVAVPFLH